MQKLQILFDKEFDYIHTSSFVRKYYGFNQRSRLHVTRSDISEVYICTKRVKSSQLTLADFHVSEWRRRWRCYYGQEGRQTADDRSRRNHGVIKFQHVTHEMFRVHSSVTFILRIWVVGESERKSDDTRGKLKHKKHKKHEEQLVITCVRCHLIPGAEKQQVGLCQQQS